MGRSPFSYIRDPLGGFVWTGGEKKKKGTNKSPEKKQTRRREETVEAEMTLDALDRAILESGVKTPEEASKRFGILLRQVEGRMMRSIPVKLGVKSYEEAVAKYKNRLPMVI